VPPPFRDLPDQVVIGKVLKPYGRRGEVRILPLTDFPERFQRLRDVTLQLPSGERIPRRIRSVQARGKVLLVAFEGCTRPEEARALRNSLVLIPRDQVMPLPEGTYYWFQIIGLRVYTDTGLYLGVVEDILETGANDVYVVRDREREILIPAVEHVVRRIDVAEGRMVIHPMEGLLE